MKRILILPIFVIKINKISIEIMVSIIFYKWNDSANSVKNTNSLGFSQGMESSTNQVQ